MSEEKTGERDITSHEDVSARVDALDGRVAEIDERTKEQQPSLPGAIKTLMEDLHAWKEGRRDFPRSAVLGVVWAYLRPRLFVYIGSVAVATFTLAQVMLLVQQNRLIAEQNRALRAQTAAALLGNLDRKDGASPAQMSLLATFGDYGIDALLQLSTDDGESGDTAREALLASFKSLSLEDRHRTTLAFMSSYNTAIRGSFPDNVGGELMEVLHLHATKRIQGIDLSTSKSRQDFVEGAAMLYQSPELEVDTSTPEGAIFDTIDGAISDICAQLRGEHTHDPVTGLRVTKPSLIRRKVMEVRTDWRENASRLGFEGADAKVAETYLSWFIIARACASPTEPWFSNPLRLFMEDATHPATSDLVPKESLDPLNRIFLQRYGTVSLQPLATNLPGGPEMN